MKKILLCAVLAAFISACSDSGSTSLPLSNGSLSIAKLSWSAVCSENGGTVNSAGECVTEGETLIPAEVCGFSGGVLNNGECVYPNAGRTPCGGRGQCVYDNATNPGQCIYDNSTEKPGCQYHGTYCQLNPDGTPVCGNNPDNCTNMKPECPKYRNGWQHEHRFMHGNGQGNGGGQGGGSGWHGGANY